MIRKKVGVKKHTIISPSFEPPFLFLLSGFIIPPFLSATNLDLYVNFQINILYLDYTMESPPHFI